MKPSVSVRKRTPTSTGLLSAWNAGLPGTAEASHAEHGQGPGGAEPTLTVMPGPADSRFAQSSTARTRRFAGPGVVGVQLNVQLAVPVAGAHVVPPSTLTSTVPTEPAASAEVPLMLIGVLVGTTAASSGKP